MSIEASARAPRTVEPRSAGQSAEMQRVLVVDDSIIARKLAARMFTVLKFEVDMASNGREALDMIMQKQYAIVLMDFTMPVMICPFHPCSFT